MAVTYPTNGTNPVLELTLPAAFTEPVDVVVTNNDSGDSLTLNLPDNYDGDDLTLDFAAQTIVDQTGADRSSLLSGSDPLWVAAPLAAGANDIEVEAVVLGTPTSSGPRSPGTLADDSSIGTEPWVDPGNSAASDNSRATVGLDGLEISHYLKATNFGFTIPTDAYVLGVIAEVERSKTEVLATTADEAIRIVKGGAIKSTDRSSPDAWPLTTDAYKTYGSSSDLWGEVWTGADINASTFGVAVAAQQTSSVGVTDTARIDHIRLTVHYTPQPAPVAYAAVASWRWLRAYW